MPKTKSKIRNAAEFKTVLETLCVDLATANDHYALFRKLMAAKEGPYTKALSQSQTFWSLTYGAHYDAAVFRLCRAYDQDLDALALLDFLETIKAKPSFLPAPQPFNPWRHIIRCSRTVFASWLTQARSSSAGAGSHSFRAAGLARSKGSD
jgi:HEPN superfamily AbiU2-like protein